MALANSATPADNSWILTADPSTLEFVRPYPYDKEGPALSRAALASREGGGLDSRGGQVWQCFHSPFHYARSPTPFTPRPFPQYDSDGRPISPMIMRGPTPDRPPVSVRMPTRAEINKRKKEEAVIGKRVNQNSLSCPTPASDLTQHDSLPGSTESGRGRAAKSGGGGPARSSVRRGCQKGPRSKSPRFEASTPNHGPNSHCSVRIRSRHATPRHATPSHNSSKTRTCARSSLVTRHSSIVRRRRKW